MSSCLFDKGTYFFIFFFFFQAEDGIRDYDVTGVQTCALPIYKGNAFTRSSISWIRHKHAIQPVDKKKPEEQTVKGVSQQFGVSPGVVYYWIANKIITARRLNRGSPYWITISPQKKRELEKWVRELNHIQSR